MKWLIPENYWLGFDTDFWNNAC